MYSKMFLLGFCMLVFGYTLSAQKVKRKGVTSNQPPKKESVATHSLSELDGKWQEVSRFLSGSIIPVTFLDSLLLHFYEGKVDVKYASGMTMAMKGVAHLEANNSLVAAGDYYTIQSLDKTNLVIDDGEFIKELEKKEQFYSESIGKATIETDSFSTARQIDINKLKGKWLVYRRQAEPGAVKAETPIIKSLEINAVSEEGIAFAVVTYTLAAVTKTQECQLVTKDGLIKFITAKETWSYKTYKADGEEFIFGDTGYMIYYAKIVK